MSDKKKHYKKLEKETSFKRSGSSTGIPVWDEAAQRLLQEKRELWQKMAEEEKGA
jgi:hypothetical protein